LNGFAEANDAHYLLKSKNMDDMIDYFETFVAINIGTVLNNL
jgi:hypothetical protein